MAHNKPATLEGAESWIVDLTFCDEQTRDNVRESRESLDHDLWDDLDDVRSNVENTIRQALAQYGVTDVYIQLGD